MSSPTQRSLKALRAQGYLAEVVEKWNPHARVRHDLFGFIDILALKPGFKLLGVQATSDSNVSSRVKKIAEHENAQIVRDAGVAIEVHGWKKGTNGRWQQRIVDCS